jgi:hypothetical protein
MLVTKYYPFVEPGVNGRLLVSCVRVQAVMFVKIMDG